MAAVGPVAKKQSGTGHAWSGLSYQKRLRADRRHCCSRCRAWWCSVPGRALYESWSVAFSVMLVIPLGALGAVIAATLRGLSNDVYFQVACSRPSGCRRRTRS
jgi:multidrug efflux pump